jgi:uncharacterized membrane protein YfcA
MPNEVILGVITLITSGITAMIGVGGGMILIAILPSFLPASVLIPIHGINQWASNFSRAVFSYKDVQLQVIPSFLLGSFLGVLMMSIVIYFISLSYVPLFIGLYILLSLHSEFFNKKIRKFENYFLIGFFQTGLSMVVGATGPLSMALLLKEFNDSNKVIATQAALMSLTHTFKIFAFIFLGFVFIDYIGVIITMMIGSILGSYIGTFFRKKIDADKFKKILKVLLTLLAFKAILSVWF